MNSLSPIVLFTYKRFETLKKTLQCLSDNFLASDSDLIIYSDGPKSLDDMFIIAKIRDYLKTISGFKSVKIYESDKNLGLATSIINGVSNTLKKYHKVIVLEDDLITSTNFLAFMNTSLKRYEDEALVFSISGFSFNFSRKFENKDGYFLNRPNSWGWGTWRDRWGLINWDLPDLNNDALNELTLLGSDVKKMFIDQNKSVIDSWHIKFIYNQFKFSGLTYYSNISKVQNIGFDEFATHTKNSKTRFFTKIDSQCNLNFQFPNIIEINIKMQKKLLKKMNLSSRIINKVLVLLKIYS